MTLVQAFPIGNPAEAQPADLTPRVDRLLSAVDGTESGFTDDGLAYPHPPRALAGSASDGLRRAFLQRALARAESDRTALAVRRASRPADPMVRSNLAATEALVRRLRTELGAAVDREPTKPRATFDGDDDHVSVRLMPNPRSATSIGYREITRDGIAANVVTAAQAIELRPTANLTGGILARLRYADGAAAEHADTMSSLGYRVGVHAALQGGEDLVVSGALLASRSANHARVEGTAAGFPAERVAVRGKVERPVWIEDWRIAPTLSVSYDKSARGSLADPGSTGASNHSGAISFGNEVSHSIMLSEEDLATLHPFVATKVNLDPLREGETSLLDPERVTTVVGAGVRAFWGGNASLLLSGEYARSFADTTAALVGELKMPFGAHTDGRPPNTISLGARADLNGLTSANVRAVVPIW